MLMDGLECTERMLSQLNAELRIDAEYFYKEKIRMQELLKSKKHTVIGLIGTVTDGIHTSIDYDENSGINLISATSPRENVFSLTRNAYISEKAHNANPRTALKKDDVILSTVGTIGNCAVVDESILPANSDRHVGIIRLEKDVNPYVLSTFLLSKYGRNQTIRESTGNNQPNLFLYKIREIIVPLFGDGFQSSIKAAVLKAREYMELSRIEYEKAEQLLEKEIGIDVNKVRSGGISIKSFSESYSKTGRFDAEYYQEKYDDYEKHVIEYKNGYTTPRKEFEYIKTKCKRDLDEYKYVEIGDVDIGTGFAEYNVVPVDELPTNAKIMTEKGDMVVSTVRPYRGAVAILGDDGLLVSGAFTVLRDMGKYPIQTLQVLFRTSLYKDWLLKYNVGTSYPVIKDDDVLDIPIPVMKKEIHDEIRDRVKKSNDLLQRGKSIIDCARLAIEKAIEVEEAEGDKILSSVS